MKEVREKPPSAGEPPQDRAPGHPTQPTPALASARDSGWVRLPSGAESIVAIILMIFLIGFPWLHPGYRFLSLAITTGYTAIALYGLGLQFGQAGIMSVGHAALIGIGAYTAAILAGELANAYYLVAAVLVLSLAVTYLMVNSAYGRTLHAIRENEPLARAVGINVDMHKIGVFMVSGAFAGTAGVLQVYYLRHISPTLYG